MLIQRGDGRMAHLESLGLCPRCESYLRADNRGRCRVCKLAIAYCIDEREEEIYLKEEVYSSCTI